MRNNESISQNNQLSLDKENTQKAIKTSGHRIFNLAKKLRSFKSEREKNPQSKYYLLSEQVSPLDTPFGRPASKRKKDKKFASGWWQDVCKSWDEDSGLNLPIELGKGLESIVNNPNYFLGIHRSDAINGQNFETDETLHSILEEGLMNLGDASSGAFYKDPPVSKTVSICPDMLHTIITLKSAYKHSTGSVILAIPSAYIKQDGEIKKGMTENVYNHNKAGYSYIKPEFILGFIQNDPKTKTMRYESRDNILKKYRENKYYQKYSSK